jgi:hypothetical protein
MEKAKTNPTAIKTEVTLLKRYSMGITVSSYCILRVLAEPLNLGEVPSL